MLSKYLNLIRFDKPIGSLLLLWPTLWGLWLASKGTPDLWILTVFVLGVFLLRSAGCIINDLADRNIDQHVARTQNRPLVTNLKKDKVEIYNAIIIACVLLLIALVLELSLNNKKLIYHSFIALLLACLYPFCKRFFEVPQFILGLAFAYSIPMAYIAVIGATDFITWFLFATSTIWTLIYDSLYAISDIKYDLKLGLKSSVIYFGKFDLQIIGILQLLFIINLIYLGYLLSIKNIIIYGVLIVLIALLFMYQLYLAQSRDPARCLAAFKNNNWVGLLVFLIFLIEYL